MNTENYTGLYHKFNIQRVDGKPIDPNAKYFILRLDENGEPAKGAVKTALLCYADEIESTQPQLAQGLRSYFNN